MPLRSRIQPVLSFPAWANSSVDISASMRAQVGFEIDPDTNRYGLRYDQGWVVDDLMLVFDVKPRDTKAAKAAKDAAAAGQKRKRRIIRDCRRPLRFVL